MGTSSSGHLLDPLSERELDVLRLLAEGLSNRAIAQKLFLSPETIKWYNRQIFSKLDVRSRTQAAARAREWGLLGSHQSQEATPHPQDNTPVPLPAFLLEETENAIDRPLFVGRTRELALLDGFLAEALEGNGRTIFIEGSAGRGKSTLFREFTRLALEKHPTLLATAGAGSAFSGTGNPYLPFRELLSLLSGDLEGRLEAGAISRQQARRIWSAVPLVVQTLLDASPDLLDVFISGSSLLARSRLAAPQGAPWLTRLEEQAARPRQTNLEQAALFSQFPEFLRRLAKQRPLLILLDDLHWADDASLGLLFHLGRRLAGSRILVMGAYRPEGLIGSADAQRHPLREVLDELQRTYGDATVDLAAPHMEEGRAFVDALLDSEPNEIDQPFREAFYRQTAGHPLFSVELLREMQNRGNLVQDAAGRWREGVTVDWETMPARVEAVISQRLAHLDKQARRILEVASVEGEIFTAEVVAQVGQYDMPRLIASISRDLVRQHRLLVPSEIERLDPGSRQATRYRFSHNLFQAYLYQALDEIERSFLHQAVGLALERLYEDRLDEIAAQLARHFQEAGDQLRAIEYLCLAGERAAQLTAFDEAIDGFSRALAYYGQLLPSQKETKKQFELHLKRGEAYEFIGKYEEAEADYRSALAFAQDDMAMKASAQFALGKLNRLRGDYDAALAWLESAREARTSLGNVGKLAQVIIETGTVLWRKSEYVRARKILKEGLKLGREAGNQLNTANAIDNLGIVATHQGDYAAARALFEDGLALRREIGDKMGISLSLVYLGYIAWHQDDYAAARALYEDGLKLKREMGDIAGVSFALLHLGDMTYSQGDYIAAQAYWDECLTLYREIGNKAGISTSLVNLAHVAYSQGGYVAARELFEEGLALCKEMDEKYIMAGSLLGLGILDLAEARPEARQHILDSLRLGQETGQLVHQTSSLVGVAGLVNHEGSPHFAAQLLGAVQSALEALNAPMESEVKEFQAQTLVVVKERLGEAAFQAAWEEGSRWSREEAVSKALAGSVE